MGTRLIESASEIREHYAGSADRPLGGYLVTVTVYSSVVAALAGADMLQFVHAWLTKAAS